MTWGFVTCGPNEALVVSGCCHRKPLLVPGGRAFVWPGIQYVQRISLNVMTLKVTSTHVNSVQGVPISVTGIAQVKIQGQFEEVWFFTINLRCGMRLAKFTNWILEEG